MIISMSTEEILVVAGIIIMYLVALSTSAEAQARRDEKAWWKQLDEQIWGGRKPAGRGERRMRRR